MEIHIVNDTLEKKLCEELDRYVAHLVLAEREFKKLEITVPERENFLVLKLSAMIGVRIVIRRHDDPIVEFTPIRYE
uniref:Uncharacterized protein n=1 Tax=Romanomermis culicivorax TaxID=13658 RepID=A0A915J4K6_ROMCU